MDFDLTQIITATISGGTVLYLIVDKLFSKKKDNAEAHGTMVASFDKEMESLRKIRLDMIEDVNVMREQLKAEQEKVSNSISGEVEILKQKIVDMKQASEKKEEQLLCQLDSFGETIQAQASQISRMVMYWKLLCDRECNKRHVPLCPFKEIEDAEDKPI